jgi:hypothetical protein
VIDLVYRVPVTAVYRSVTLRIFRTILTLTLEQRTITLTTSWSVYAGADEEVFDMIKADDEDPDDRVGNAIELAIIGNAKRFIKSNAAQRVINSIWRSATVTSLPKLIADGFVAANACTNLYLVTPFYPIHTSVRRCISMTHTKRLC